MITFFIKWLVPQGFFFFLMEEELVWSKIVACSLVAKKSSEDFELTFLDPY